MTQIRRGAFGSFVEWLERHPIILPLLILLTGAIFRFYNLNWDSGQELHPDERGMYMLISGINGRPPLGWPSSVGQFFDVKTSPLNPGYFAYGSLPYYVLTLLAGSLATLGQHVSFLSSWATLNTYGGLPMVGRPLSAVLDLAALVVLYLIARRMFDYWVAVLALALGSWTVLDIQMSHFYQVDSLLLPLALLTLLGAVIIAQTDNRAAYIWSGIALGAALASKTTALLLVVPLGVAPLLAALRSRPFPTEGALATRLRAHYGAVAMDLNTNLQWLLVSYLLAAVAFFVGDPYAVLDRSQLLSDIGAQQTYLVTNNPPFVVPFTIQYANTLPYLYQLKNLLWWCLGAPLGFAAFAGVLYYLWRNARGHVRNDQVVVLIWVFAYFLFVGRFFAKFNRYMLPITPFLILLGAAVLVHLARARDSRVRFLGFGAIAIVALGSFAYSLAYMNIYAHPNTRVAASRWMYTHVPAGAKIATEGAWDDPLPLGVDGRSPSQYVTAIGGQPLGLNLYDPDTPAKISHMASILSSADYLVMSSERIDRSIPRLPDRYPLTIRYYNLLFSGRLPYRLVEHFQQHPQLGPFVVHDYAADESFHVYDHPDVRIYKRVANVKPQTIAALIMGKGTGTAPASASIPAPDTRLTLSQSQWKADQQGQTLDQMFPPAGFGMQHPVIAWLFLLELLGLLAFPATFLLFRNLPDGGWVIGKTVGLLILGYFVWIVVRLGAATYERGFLVLASALCVLASAGGAYLLRRDLRSALRDHWRAMLAGEAVFLAGFALFLLLRMWYPDLGHQFSPVSAANVGQGRMGEKQMELAFLNAIVRSRVFPPYDPFFAHGYINYYYYGFFLVGTLCKLTQIVPATGFNLAIATFFGLLVGNVFSAVLALTRRVAAGVVGAVLVGLVGNLNGAWQLIQDLMQVATVHSSVPLVGGIADMLSGLWQVIVVRQALPPFDYWGPTRIVPPVGGPITEFPFFTYLFADLHPHLMAYPMTVAVVALAVNALRSVPGSRRVQFVTTILSGILVGAIAVTNPWDFPTYLGVLGVGLAVGAYATRRRFEVRDILTRAALLVGTTLAAVALYIPFKHDYQTVFASGIGLVRNVDQHSLYQQFAGTPGTCGAPGLPSCNQLVHDTLVTPLHIYLEHFGLFVFILLSYVFLLLSRDAGGSSRLRRAWTGVQFSWYYRERFGRVRRARRTMQRMRMQAPPAVVDLSLLFGFAVLCVGLLAIGDYLLAFLVMMLGLIVLVLERLRGDLPVAGVFVLCLLAVPVALSILTQIFFVKDFLAGGTSFRMNTIFKFYNQAWVLYAICAAVALDQLYRRWAEAKDEVRSGESIAVGSRRPRTFFPVAHLRLALAAPLTSSPFQRHSQTIPAGGTATDPESSSGSDAPAGAREVPKVRAGRLRLWSLWASALVLLVVGSLIYTYAGTVSRETMRATWLPENSVPFTLDGMAFMKPAYPDEYRAISWLNGHVSSAQVIAEADGAYYDWRSRVTMFTGLPTIINGIHEGEQRYADEIDPSTLCNGVARPDICSAHLQARSTDLHTLYNSTDATQFWRVIREYGVRYIYVGFSEKQCVPAAQQCYTRAGLAKFHRMVGHGLSIVYRNPGVTIYRVERA